MMLATRLVSHTLRIARASPLYAATRLYTTSKGGKVFETTEADFDKDVINSDIPTIVDFYANWCQPCRALTPQLTKAVQEDGRVNLARIDADENLELARTYELTALPTVIAFIDGKPVSRFIGAYPPIKYSTFISRLFGEEEEEVEEKAKENKLR